MPRNFAPLLDKRLCRWHKSTSGRKFTPASPNSDSAAPLLHVRPMTIAVVSEQSASDATRYHPAYPIVRIHLLGRMRATTCFGNNILPQGRKARATLAYLCLSP